MSQPMLKYRPRAGFRNVLNLARAALFGVPSCRVQELLELFRSYRGGRPNSIILGGPLGWSWHATLDSQHHGSLTGPVDAHRHSDLADIGIDDHHDRDHALRHDPGNADALSTAYFLTDGSLGLAGTLKADGDAARDIGASSLRWRNGYFSGVVDQFLAALLDRPTPPGCVLDLDFSEGFGVGANDVDLVKARTTVYDRSGNNNDGTLYPAPLEVTMCESTDDWTGTSLSTDTDCVEGSYAVKDDITSPTIGTNYSTEYNPSGSWDLSGKNHLVFWLKCDRASTAFTSARVYVYDTSNNWRYWDITFAADTWSKQKVLLSTGDGESGTAPDLSSVDKITWEFVAADTTAFYKLIDAVFADDRPVFTDGVFGKSLDFDGVDDYVNCGHDASFDTITDELTIEAWVKRGGTGTEQAILAKYSETGGRSYELGFRADDKIFFDVSGNAGATVGYRLYYYTHDTFAATDVWYHIVATVSASGDDIHIYVNGVEAAGSRAGFNYTPSIYVSTANVCLGKREVPTNPHYFNGQIAGARVYNGVITAEMVREWYRQGILPVQVTHASTWMVGIALMLLVWGVLVKAVKKAFA